MGNVTNLKLKEHETIISVFDRFGKFLVIFFQEKACNYHILRGLWRAQAYLFLLFYFNGVYIKSA